MTFREWVSQPFLWGKQGVQAAVPAVKHPLAWVTVLVLGSMAAGAIGVGYLPQKQPSIDLPAEVKVPQDGLYTFSPSVVGGPVEWEVLDGDVTTIQMPGSNALIAHFPKAGVKHIHARTAAGSAIACKRVTITVGDVPPGPGPGPGPGPNPPVDPLAQLLTTAWQQETDANKAHEVTLLAALYHNAAASLVNDESLKTLADLNADLKKAGSVLLPDTALPKVRTALAGYLAEQLGTKGSTPLDAALRQKAGTVFTSVANALGGLK